MRTTLISFLGNSRQSGDYRRVRYRYQGETLAPVTYIGYALRKVLQPERFVILGTTGSMWDHLFESDLELEGQHEEERLALMESVEEGTCVTQAQLDKLAPLLSKALGSEVILKIIPPARTEEEQIELLGQIESVLEDGPGKLYLDVTHGYRSMPMVSFAAVQFLNTVKPEIQVENIFYGELGHDGDPVTGCINELSGLLSLNQWNKAFSHSELTGDYSLIAALIPEDEELAELISDGSFYESIHLTKRARSTFAKARQRLEGKEFTGPAALFKPVLLKRTKWVEEPYASQRQEVQAFQSLENSDYLRAALYGYEAYLTSRMQADPDYRSWVGDDNARTDFAKKLRNSNSFNDAGEKEQFRLLRLLRNAFAHGEQSLRREHQPVVESSKQLNIKLKKALEVLLR